jgi:hypothetical protein
MRQQIATVTGNASASAKSSNVIAMDNYITPFNVGFGVVVSGTTTTVSYIVQHTFDNPQTVASPTWFTHPTFATTAGSASQDGNYAFPVAAIKVVANGTNTATLTMTVIQAGNSQ